MLLHSVDLRTTGQFPALLLDYLDQKPSLKEFYNVYPTLANAQELITQRTDFPIEKRRTLVSVLEKQYEGLDKVPDFSVLLDEKTFTVTTGHQLNVCTGPLYVIYKIVTTINLARALQEAYPDYRFVPLYWMATEDHDFEEIASFHLFGKKYTWKGTYSGAVGRLNPHELKTVLDELPEQVPLFEKAYLEQSTLADAVRCYMHALFGAEGLISLDADEAELKRHFLPVINDELLHQVAEKQVADTSARLETLGYHTPVHARDINLFYLTDGTRERIVREEGTFQVLHTDLTFSPEAILQEAEAHPERFSPNVVLRPLYQETILPNLAYVGGPSEVPYWMQLKGVFAHYQVPFPLLIPRNFALYVTTASRKRLEKLGLSYEELFTDRPALRRLFVERHSAHTLHLEDEKQGFCQVFDDIFQKASAVDVTMEDAVRAERARLYKSLEKLEKRIRKAEERHHETELTQLQTVLDKFFPKGTPQERHDNFLNFYLNDRNFLKKLLAAFQPLDFRFTILIED
ncbi:bacillithiol biosynthesis cysteine-adding enzyme BshC [Rhabdobacter roseus]|uniref:Putative cysteine ligase BshC n=1 Tax=Rhabdobacter roseus TaxID=1655419 RepID=A0A840TSW9_9BACT|nr:bacillithiol biosynthesis cysteine-adding enzyme BshC [Rhabdobacter roseus]MBB5284777.1 bacillithiol biosynthesis cysteine-adding enzyme BshC [Rhabdobacter roseus]